MSPMSSSVLRMIFTEFFIDNHEKPWYNGSSGRAFALRLPAQLLTEHVHQNLDPAHKRDDSDQELLGCFQQFEELFFGWLLHVLTSFPQLYYTTFYGGCQVFFESFFRNFEIF